MRNLYFVLACSAWLGLVSASITPEAGPFASSFGCVTYQITRLDQKSTGQRTMCFTNHGASIACTDSIEGVLLNSSTYWNDSSDSKSAFVFDHVLKEFCSTSRSKAFTGGKYLLYGKTRFEGYQYRFAMAGKEYWATLHTFRGVPMRVLVMEYQLRDGVRSGTVLEKLQFTSMYLDDCSYRLTNRDKLKCNC